MKNIFLYYFLIIAPLGILFFLAKAELITAIQFVGILFLYILVYRPYIDGVRLAAKDVISRKEIWKMAIPGKRFKYLKELYLK